MTDKKPRRTESPVPLHLYLGRAMEDRPDLTNVEMAKRLGYSRPNVIAMMRTGSMKVPIGKAPALAEILGLDPIAFLLRVLFEYEPEVWATLQSVLGDRLVTEHEMAVLEVVRHAVGGLDVDLAGADGFASSLHAMINVVLDRHVMSQLAERKPTRSARDSVTAKRNAEMETMIKRQALERIALRREPD